MPPLSSRIDPSSINNKKKSFGSRSVFAIADNYTVLSAVFCPTIVRSYRQRQIFTDGDNVRVEEAAPSNTRRWICTCQPPLHVSRQFSGNVVPRWFVDNVTTAWCPLVPIKNDDFTLM